MNTLPQTIKCKYCNGELKKLENKFSDDVYVCITRWCQRYEIAVNREHKIIAMAYGKTWQQ